MKKITLWILFAMINNYVSPVLAQENPADEGKRIDEIIKGERTNCNHVADQGMTPTLLFETLSPKMTVNEPASILSLQMKIIYYRCIKKNPSDSPEFMVASPSTPYKYTVEQLDGSANTINVNHQAHRFNIKFKSLTLEPGYPQKIGSTGNVHLIQLDIPLKKLLTPSQEIQLRNGSELNLSLPVVSEVSTDYAIGTQTKSNTGFAAGSTFTWNFKLSMKGKKTMKVELQNIKQ